MKQAFIKKRFNTHVAKLIEQASAIINEYMADGYVVTLRQLYYQMVSRDMIPNNLKSYKRLGSAMSDARLAGLVDWDSMEDRVRGLERKNFWDNPTEILDTVSKTFHYDHWVTQPTRLEVWPEKDAISGVVERGCEDRYVPHFACRGYTSQSAQYEAAERFRRYLGAGQDVVVLHIGDHDPSGLDMTRDNIDRLEIFLKNEFGEGAITIQRIALNWDQVKKYKPPPNPVKFKDSRSPAYVKQYGKVSWELDALDPKVIVDLIHKHVEPYIDNKAWDIIAAREVKARKRLTKLVKPSMKWKL